MERALEEMLDERSARLFRKTEYLSIIGNVSPMIGLLGTVTGMIMLFAEIHAADAFPGARVVADRIAVALITTFWGLAVAIPSLAIHAVFRNRIDVLTAECALTAERLLATFKPGATSAMTSTGTEEKQ
jgi:biopolymer transport protein ExbB